MSPMSPEQQRIAIAKACGWQFHTPSCALMDVRECDEYQEPPDYLNDLNAMHEAVKILTDDQYEEFTRILAALAGYNPEDGWKYRDTQEASAKTRALAFLDTLNIWTEDQEHNLT